jgi:hypothetical protein
MNSLEDPKVIFARENGLVKFVRVGEEFRFTENRSHKNLLDEGEIAVSAGFIYHDTNSDGKKVYRLTDEWSMTLTKGPDYGPDKALLEKLLGTEVKTPSHIILD